MVLIRPNSNFHILWGFSQTVVCLLITNTKVVTIGESMPQVQAAPNGNVLPNVNLLSSGKTSTSYGKIFGEFSWTRFSFGLYQIMFD